MQIGEVKNFSDFFVTKSKNGHIYLRIYHIIRENIFREINIYQAENFISMMC